MNNHMFFQYESHLSIIKLVNMVEINQVNTQQINYRSWLLEQLVYSKVKIHSTKTGLNDKLCKFFLLVHVFNELAWLLIKLPRNINS